MSRDHRIVILGGLLAILLVALLSQPSKAAKPAPFTFSGGYGGLCVVEQWTVRLYGSDHIHDACPGPEVVNNPTGCTWTRDDSWALRGYGDIAGTVSGSVCDVADGTAVYGRTVDASVIAKSYLAVTLSTSDGRSWAMPAVRDGNGYTYTACTRNDPPGPYAPVEGSNGGYGNPITYTLTIEGRARDVRALIDVGNGLWSVAECAR